MINVYSLLAQDICGPIGNSHGSSVTHRMDRMLYLNTANPATCSGNITSWKVCYYGPESIDLSTYWATYAVYRRSNHQSDGGHSYKKVSSTFSAVRATSLLAVLNYTGAIDGPIQQGGFRCYTDFIDSGTSPLTIQVGDVLGACIFDPIDSKHYNRRQLDIVGEIDGESLLGTGSRVCTTDSLPLDIPVHQLSTVPRRRLHLYANIGTLVITIQLEHLCSTLT